MRENQTHQAHLINSTRPTRHSRGFHGRGRTVRLKVLHNEGLDCTSKTDIISNSAASRNFEKGARSCTHFQKAGQPEYFWATHPFNAKHPFNIYLCITILQEALISIITNFLFLKNTFKIQKIYYNRCLPFLLSRDKKSRTISSSKC